MPTFMANFFGIYQYFNDSTGVISTAMDDAILILTLSATPIYHYIFSNALHRGKITFFTRNQLLVCIDSKSQTYVISRPMKRLLT
jgi:hypothetical protein